MAQYKQAWILLTLVLLASAVDLPARLSYISSTLPIVRLWFDPEEQNRLQYPAVPHDLLRAADRVIPRDAGVVFITAGTDVRHGEYVAFHRALYLLAPRAIWWLTPAPSDGTWESRWWLSHSLTRESVLAVAGEKHASFVVAYSVNDLILPGHKIIDMKDGCVVHLSDTPVTPASDTVSPAYASTYWPLRIALAVLVIFIIGSVVLSAGARLGYHATGVEGAAVAWSLGAGLTSIGMLWLNALGVGLRGQIALLSVVAACALLLKAKMWFAAIRRRPGQAGNLRFSLLNTLLILFLVMQVLLVTIMAAGGPLHFWDSWVNWAMKARMIYVEGHISPALYLDSSRSVTLLDYPLMFPLVEAWLFEWIGAPDDRLIGLLSVIFYLALAAISYAAVRRWGGGGSSSFALLTAVSIISIPHLAGQAGSVFAEVPLAVFTGIAALYLAEWLEHGSKGALLISALAAGFMPWTKREGLILLPVLCAATFIASKEKRRAWIGLCASVFAAVIIAGPWYAFVAWKGVVDPAFMPVNFTTLMSNASRFWFIAIAELKSLSSPNWGFVWPLGLLFGLSSRLARTGATNLLSVTSLFYLSLIALVYLFSAYEPYQQHVISSIDRVIAPVVQFPVLWIASRAVMTARDLDSGLRKADR